MKKDRNYYIKEYKKIINILKYNIDNPDIEIAKIKEVIEIIENKIAWLINTNNIITNDIKKHFLTMTKIIENINNRFSNDLANQLYILLKKEVTVIKEKNEIDLIAIEIEYYSIRENLIIIQDFNDLELNNKIEELEQLFFNFKISRLSFFKTKQNYIEKDKEYSLKWKEGVLNRKEFYLDLKQRINLVNLEGIDLIIVINSEIYNKIYNNLKEIYNVTGEIGEIEIKSILKEIRKYIIENNLYLN